MSQPGGLTRGEGMNRRAGDQNSRKTADDEWPGRPRAKQQLPQSGGWQLR